ncbi:MAG: tRNA 2-selenouridine(34) synthase MnmH [Paracoccaceae bacterium]
MAFALPSLDALRTAGFDTIIDVRAPAEFAEDHVPGAVNLPVLSDAERAEVGTIYKQVSPFTARKRGAALVAKNAAHHLETALSGMEGGWRPLVYCWRGGQRSGSFASILAQIGWRVETLDGGYRSYRRLVVNRLYETTFPAPLVLLDGNTGTAKTALLGLIARRDVQVLDLEGMAGHRGSALGGQGAQPSQKAFESQLAQAITALDPERPVVVEAESSRIGQINLPSQLFQAMRAAPRIRITAPVEARAAYLCGAYADLVENAEALEERLSHLVRLQGHARVAEWRALAAAGAYQALAEDLIRCHYDPRYDRLRAAQDAACHTVDVKALTPDALERVADEIALALPGLVPT